MRHQNSGRKLGRNSSHRKAMYRNMVTSLFEHGRVQTTDSKAKEVRRIAEKLITMARKNDLASRRRAFSYVRSRTVVAKLFDEITPGFGARPGGYTRILKLGNRKGDNAPVSLIELVTEAYSPKAPAKKAAPEVKKAAPVVAPAVAAPVEETAIAEETAPAVEEDTAAE